MFCIIFKGLSVVLNLKGGLNWLKGVVFWIWKGKVICWNFSENSKLRLLFGNSGRTTLKQSIIPVTTKMVKKIKAVYDPTCVAMVFLKKCEFYLSYTLNNNLVLQVARKPCLWSMLKNAVRGLCLETTTQ